MTRSIISITLILAIFLAPFSVFAQTASCSTVTSDNFSDCCANNSSSTAATQAACLAYYSNGGSSSANGNGLNTSGTNSTGLSGNNGSTTAITPTTGLSGGAQYTPTVQLQFGSNGSFGGLTFKGVGASLLACSGFGSFLSGAVTKGLNTVLGAVGSAASTVGGLALKGLNVITGGVSGTIVNFFKGKPKPPGVDPQHPAYTSAVQSDPLVQKAACLDGIAYVLSQQVLQQITNRTLAWANTGFGGNPLYIKDINSYLLSLRNQQVNSFLSTSPANNDPIFGNALRSVITLRVSGRSDGLLNAPLNTPQSQQYNLFMGDFTNGGWSALLNPNYNSLGAFYNANDVLQRGIATSQQNAQNELQQGNGFLGMKTCVQTVADLNKGQVSNSTTNGAGLKNSNNPDSTCLKYQTVTPGSIVALQVANITNSPVRQAELATQFNQAVGSFFDSLLKQLFSRGLSGIKGTPNQADLGLDYGGLGSNDVIGADGSVLADINAGQPSINDIAAKNSGTVDISRPQLLRAIIKTQYDYLNVSTDSDLIMDRLVPEMGQLDYCLPGPNPSWQDSLDDNVNTYLGNAVTSNVSILGTIHNTDLTLFDKFTQNDVPVADRSLTVVGTNLLTPSDAKSYIQSVSASLKQYISTEFSRDAIGNDYAATTVGTAAQDYARGMAEDAYDEVSTLPTFAATAVNNDQQYVQNIANAQNDIAQLQAINTQVLQIVSAAKTRYTAEQKAAGTPVNQACLDAAYKIDNSAITGITRQEPNVVNPIVQQFLDANTYFYNSL